MSEADPRLARALDPRDRVPQLTNHPTRFNRLKNSQHVRLEGQQPTAVGGSTKLSRTKTLAKIAREAGDENVGAGRAASQLGWYEFARRFVDGRSVRDVGCD